MIDFHSHILPAIDDGSKSIEDSIQILREAREAGFSKIISTSHYLEGYYEVEEEERKRLIQELRNEDIGLELYVGSEIYITENMIDLLKGKKASSINNSKYVLFEIPMNNKTMLTKEIIYRLIENGYVPVLAHPERYSFIQQNSEELEELVDMGALCQSNYGSIIGLYGKKTEKTVKKLLKNNLIHFFGSDVHRQEQIYNKIPKAIKKIKKIISEDKFIELSEINPQKVLNNEEIE